MPEPPFASGVARLTDHVMPKAVELFEQVSGREDAKTPELFWCGAVSDRFDIVREFRSELVGFSGDFRAAIAIHGQERRMSW
jgi:hypothetical protein